MIGELSIQDLFTLSFGDIILVSIITLGLTYLSSYIKKSAELEAVEKSKDRERRKKEIVKTVTQIRKELLGLGVYDFEKVQGKRFILRMYVLAEELSKEHSDLAERFCSLVNAPKIIQIMKPADRQKLKKKYFKDRKWALNQCAEIKENPFPKK